MKELELFKTDKEQFKSQVQKQLYTLAQQKIKECQKNVAKGLFKEKDSR